MSTPQQELEELCQIETFLSLPNKNIKKIINLLDSNEIDTSFSIQMTSYHKGSLLEFALATGSYALVKKVLEKIKNPHQRNTNQQSAWHHWAKGAYLLKKIQNPNKKIYQGADRPSLFATDLAVHPSCDIAQLLIDAGMQVLIKEPDDLGYTPMHALLASGGDKQSVQFLFNHGASFLDTNVLNETPISLLSDHLLQNNFLLDLISNEKKDLLTFSLNLKQQEESKLKQLKTLKKIKKIKPKKPIQKEKKQPKLLQSKKDQRKAMRAQQRKIIQH